jgi:hypothetical protein
MKNLYQVAVLIEIEEEFELLVKPTPVMAVDEKAAEYQGVLLATVAASETDDTFDPSKIKVIARPF